MKICIREGCDNELTGKQRKYCGKTCKFEHLYLINRDHRLAYQKEWAGDNPDLVNDWYNMFGRDTSREMMRKRRLNGQGGGTQKFAKQLVRIQNNKCRYCGCKLESNLSNVHVDHIHPVARRDTYKGLDINEPLNLTAACVDCNKSKLASLPVGKWEPRRLNAIQKLNMDVLNRRYHAEKEKA